MAVLSGYHCLPVPGELLRKIPKRGKRRNGNIKSTSGFPGKGKSFIQKICKLGGNVLCIGGRPDGEPFKVGVQKPFADRNETAAVVDINGRSVVSSGIYERCFKQDGKLYHHILDPHTGYPYDNGLISVTIISDRSVDGDALSTTCFALGLKKGLAFAEKKGVQAVFITKDYELHYTKDFQKKIKVSQVD